MKACIFRNLTKADPVTWHYPRQMQNDGKEKLMKITIIPYERKYFDELFNLVHLSIESIYPLYYPRGAVDFFHNHHSRENMNADIPLGKTLLALKDDRVIGTGSVVGNEIKRFFMLPQERSKGYGRILFPELEKTVSENGFNEALLDASLCSCNFYRRSNYEVKKYHAYALPCGEYLCYYEMRKALNSPAFSQIDYNGRIFTTSENSSSGEVDCYTIFRYRQEGSTVWAEYSGGAVRKGFLLGKTDTSGKLEFSYLHINANNETRTGICTSVPVFLSDGRIELIEKWQWTNGGMEKGESRITEISMAED